MINISYVINLKRRQERKSNMINEFNRLGDFQKELNYTFFEAIDGEDENLLKLLNVKPSKWYNRHTGKAFTKGELGCALSHYSIWTDVIHRAEKEDNPETFKALILEDDVHFCHNFSDKLTEIMKEICFEYDLLYLGRDPCKFSDEIIVTPHVRKTLYSYGAHAYLLTYMGAKKLINSGYLENILPVDDFLAIMYGCITDGPGVYFSDVYQLCDKLKCYAVYPVLIKLTNPFESDTYVSNNYSKNQFKFDLNKELLIIYRNHNNLACSHQRFLSYCELYGQTVSVMDNGSTLKDELSKWNNQKLNSTLVMYIPRQHSLVLSHPAQIIQNFDEITNQDKNKAIMDLGSSCIIGWGNVLVEVTNGDFTKVIKDEQCKIFLSLDMYDHNKVQILERSSRIKIENEIYPCTTNAYNLKSQLFLNCIENYTGNNWNQYYGFGTKLIDLKIEPKIYVIIYSKSGNYPINQLNYPRDKLVIKYVEPVKNKDKESFNTSLIDFMNSDCQYMCYIEERFVLTNPNTFQMLLKHQKDVITPMIRATDGLWCNFWGELDDNGYYKRSFDYLDIINNRKKGCWNVPYVTGIYLVNRKMISDQFFTDNLYSDFDMQTCHEMRKKGIFMYVTNMDHFGYIS